MDKYKNLSFALQKELLESLCEAILLVKSKEEAVNLLADLLTKEEVMKLAKRIAIAQMLLEGKNYLNIKDSLRVSEGTIAKIASWLGEGGEGFKLVFQRKPKQKIAWAPSERFDLAISEWKRVKKRYPSMFWPSLLVGSIIESADEKERQKMKQALEKLSRKSAIYKEASEFFKKSFENNQTA